MSPRRLTAVGLGLLALSAAGGRAQLAQGPGYRLTGYVISGTGGGGASSAAAGYGATAAFGSATPPTSFSFRASAGFVAATQPLSGNAPVLFGVDPPVGPATGGTTLRLTGIGLTRLATPLTVRVDGFPATNVQRLSDLAVTCTTPGGTYGPVAVELSDGTTTLQQSFVYVPGVVTAPFATLGTELRVACHGIAGTHFLVYGALAPAQIPFPPFGTLLLDPTTLFLTAQGSFPAPPGLVRARLPVPDAPALSGLVLYFQLLSVDVAALPIVVRLTNRAVAQLL